MKASSPFQRPTCLPAPNVVHATVFPRISSDGPTTPPFGFQPAVNFGPSIGREPGIGANTYRANILNAAGPGPATYPGTNPPAFPPVPPVPDAPQVGGGGLIDTGGDHQPRTTVVQQGNSLWLTQATAVS